MNFFAFTAVAFCALATTLTAHEYKLGDLVVDHPMAFATAPTAQTGGGFMAITNNGSMIDTLTSVTADFPRVEIHTTEMDGDVARMMQLVDGVGILPGQTIALMPGGMHIMFMGLRGDPFEVGEEIPATLLFENAGSVDVVFDVQERSTDDARSMDHSGH
ncbi:MAG: copper(I)-binding protein [Yoonia sp.]|jgi:copper(I)-binding protein